MRLLASVAAVAFLSGCGSTNDSLRLPAPGARPATKKELPWLTVPGGRMKTTLFYGPWQCNQRWMTDCERECTLAKRPLMGCMWLADLKLDWQGSIIAPLPVEAGGRYALFHCCCDYPTLTKAENEVARKQWERFRDAFREEWSKKFGEWPAGKESWAGHHIRDLKHGGDPTDPNNIIPVEPGAHDEFGRRYPACYAGKDPWNKVGPDLPYTDY